MLGVVGAILSAICFTFLMIYLENNELKYLRAILITVLTGLFYYLTLTLNFFKRKRQTRETLEEILVDR